MDPSTLIDRLAAHRTIGSVPKSELAWLVAHGGVRTLEPGETLTPATGPVRGMYVVLDGQLSIRVDRGAGPRMVMEWHGGDVTGVLPYSRIRNPPAPVVADAPTEMLMIEAADVPRLIHECPELTAVLVHVMLDRTRVFKSSELLDEKLVSLGRLAAGLAHELNNPASAVERSAKTLLSCLAVLNEATKRFCSLNIPDAECFSIAGLRKDRTSPPPSFSPIERADRQDQLDDWLAAHQVSGLDVEPLVGAGVTAADLDRLAALVGPPGTLSPLSKDKLETVLTYVTASESVRQLAAEIDTAASRIHSLVSAVKGFTYVNQQATLQPIAIERGLSDTITVLRSKAKSKSVAVDLNVAPDLPSVEGYGGELNQVWANLLDNAIDATPGGHVRIAATSADGKVVVKIIDDGPGIPADIVKRIFDPFFTTKDVGEGTGLGLDIARRIVLRHHGVIDLFTSPGSTEFRVSLPVAASAA